MLPAAATPQAMNPAHTSTNPASGRKARYAEIPPRTAILKERAKSGDITQHPFVCINVARRLQRQLLHAVRRLCAAVPLVMIPAINAPRIRHGKGAVTSRRGPRVPPNPHASRRTNWHSPRPLQPSLRPVGNFLRMTNDPNPIARFVRA